MCMCPAEHPSLWSSALLKTNHKLALVQVSPDWSVLNYSDWSILRWEKCRVWRGGQDNLHKLHWYWRWCHSSERDRGQLQDWRREWCWWRCGGWGEIFWYWTIIINLILSVHLNNSTNHTRSTHSSGADTAHSAGLLLVAGMFQVFKK